MFNELKEQGDNPVEYIKELNAMAHREDPTRPTTSASNQDGALNFITDHIAWNRYDGWYGATPATLATWLDATHKNHPEIKLPSANMVLVLVSIISRTHWYKLFPEVGGIQRIGKQNIIFRIGK